MELRRIIIVSLAFVAGCAYQNATAQELGFILPDLDGKPVRLERLPEKKLTVVCFLGTECPLAKLYASQLNKFSSQFADIRFIGVCSNQQDSIDDLRSFRDQHKISFPLVKDRNNVVADQFNARRTPEVYLLDQDLTVQYRGRIDDQYQPGIAKSNPQRHDLRIALTESIANQPVTIGQTEPEGCLIGRVKQDSNPLSKVTYANQISRILQNHCAECHREGQIGPMELADYDEVVGWADMIVEVVNENRMPPWHADPNHGKFSNERRMTSAEKQMLHDWVAAGTPKGDVADLPEPRKFVESALWRLPKEPDVAVAMRSKPFTIPAEGTVEYQYFVVDPGFTEDKWITAAEILPGNRSVLHHSIVFVRPPDGSDIRGIGWLAAYVPGQSAPAINPKFGRRIPAGSRFVFQQHYTPIGRETTDTTQIGLIFGNEPEIEHEVFTLLAMDQEFVIPPGAENYQVSAKFRWLPQRGSLLGISPHMHFRGKSFELTAQMRNSIDGTTSPETLLRVPKYDFNWQHIYQLQNPIPTANIESLEFVAAFDNSENNPANPDPSQHVTWGDQTWEEMAVGFVIVSEPRKSAESNDVAELKVDAQKWKDYQSFIQKKVDTFVDGYFNRIDLNRDGQILGSEYPRSVRDHGFWQIDLNGDGIVSRDEVVRSARRRFMVKYPFDSFQD